MIWTIGKFPLLKTKTVCSLFPLGFFTCVIIFLCRLPAGGGKAGPGRWLGLLHGEAVSDGPELHTAAHPHPALYLWGRRLEGLLLVHRARRRQNRGMTCIPEPTLIWRVCSGLLLEPVVGWFSGYQLDSRSFVLTLAALYLDWMSSNDKGWS